MSQIGFMQGRLSPRINGKIQAFPWESWRTEFHEAKKIGLSLMEWTLDQERLYENPLMTDLGQVEIKQLALECGVHVGSLTGDCFMQAPFYKKNGAERESLIRDFENIISACSKIGIRYVVVPLVDDGRLENCAQEADLKNVLESRYAFLRDRNVMVIFESDFEPKRLKEFLACFPADVIGLNYDIGNSASLDFDPDEEFPLVGQRVVNVHVKDRIRGGTTVPLGTGNADFTKVFSWLKKIGYAGDFILQTARAENNDHSGVLIHYKKMTEAWISN